MAIQYISGTSAGSTTGANVTTSAIDTTNANLIVISLAYYSNGVINISDNKGNTYTARTVYSGTIPKHVLYYCLNPTVGSGHTFTVTSSSSLPTISVMAFSGIKATGAYHSENGFGGSSTISQQTGSVTPPEDNCLIITGVNAYGNTSASTINSGFSDPATTGTYTLTDAGHHFGGAISYLIQNNAATVNPTWTYGGVATTSAAMSIAVFKSDGTSNTKASFLLNFM